MSDKSLILVFPFDLMSHFFGSLRVAVSLNDHYEVYMKWSDKYAYWLKKSGLQTFNCVDLNAETALEKTGEFDFSWLNASALEAVFLEQVKVIKEYNPTLVIGDTSFTLKMAAEATGVHYLSILNGYSTRYYKLTRKLSPNHPAMESTSVPAPLEVGGIFPSITDLAAVIRSLIPAILKARP